MSAPHLWVVSFLPFPKVQFSLTVWKRPRGPTLSQRSVEAKVRQTKHWYLCDAPDGDMKVWWIYWDLSPRPWDDDELGDELGCSLYMGSHHHQLFGWMPTVRCHVGLRQVPITFGEFNVSDVRPAQLFNILVDIEGQLKWDESMSEAGFSSWLWWSNFWKSLEFERINHAVL